MSKEGDLWVIMSIYSITLYTSATGSGFACLSSLDFSGSWSFGNCQEYLPLSLSWGNSGLAERWFNSLETTPWRCQPASCELYEIYSLCGEARPQFHALLLFSSGTLFSCCIILPFYQIIRSTAEKQVCVKLKLFVWGMENRMFAVHLSYDKADFFFLL